MRKKLLIRADGNANIGARHGEKLYETLLTNEEKSDQKILVTILESLQMRVDLTTLNILLHMAL